MSAYYGYDEWDRPSRPEAPRRDRRTSNYLDPNAGYRGSLYRTRSVGNAPTPVVNVYNDIVQDSNVRADSRAPSRSPPAPSLYPMPYAVSPEPRGRRLNDELLAEEIAELRLDRMDRMRRSRSRGRSDASSRSPDYRWEVERLEREREREKRDIEQREVLRREEERIRAEIKLKELQDDRFATADRKRIIGDYERQQREEEDHIKEAEERLQAKLERKKREQKEAEERLKERIEREKREQRAEEERLKERMEREKREQKAEEERIKEKFAREEREKKEREKREWDDFLRRQKEEEERKKAAKKAEEDRLEAEMRKRFLDLGYTQEQVEVLIDPKKAAQAKKAAQTVSNELALNNATRAPVYAKVHTDYLSIETLRYYDIPWRYDELDPSYIIILREMEKRDTDLLFEHTKQLRTKRLLIEAPAKKDKQYAFYRERSKSRTRNGGEWKKFGILEYKK